MTLASGAAAKFAVLHACEGSDAMCCDRLVCNADPSCTAPLHTKQLAFPSQTSHHMTQQLTHQSCVHAGSADICTSHTRAARPQASCATRCTGAPGCTRRKSSSSASSFSRTASSAVGAMRSWNSTPCRPACRRLCCTRADHPHSPHAAGLCRLLGRVAVAPLSAAFTCGQVDARLHGLEDTMCSCRLYVMQLEAGQAVQTHRVEKVTLTPCRSTPGGGQTHAGRCARSSR